MDAHTGLLMAVKQVELPTGVLRNEERKQSMVTALEREIELLKDLQHENIVQYLGESNDLCRAMPDCEIRRRMATVSIFSSSMYLEVQ